MATRGQKRHLVDLFGPGEEVPDGDGGYTQVPAALEPAQMYAEIKPATARDLERVVANTVQSKASHLVTMDYHPQVSTETRVHFGARIFAVTGVQNPEEKNVELVLACEEVVT
jgi:head-tail adaptor